MPQTRLTKRDFLKGATASALGLAAGGVLGGCDRAARAPLSAIACGVPDKWENEADVVVVGGGGGGLAAVIEAGKAGAKVILIEKEVTTGGDTVLCGGHIAGHETRLCKAKGIRVTGEQVWQHFLSVPQAFGTMPLEVAKLCADKGGETIDWLESVGVVFEDEVVADPNYTGVLPIMHQVKGGGTGLGKPLLTAAQKTGAEILLETRATALIVDGNGRVVGVTAEANGEIIHIKSRRATVLTTGGYGANAEMIAAFDPAMKGIGYVCSAGSTGDGLAMAMAVGAITVRNSYGPFVFPTVDTENNTLIRWHTIQGGGVAVGEDGKRFLNEDLTYVSQDLPRAVMAQIAKQKKPYVWMILVDSPQLTSELEVYHPKLAKADTIEELAVMVELDPASLKATIEQYNGFCAQKQDPDFGRKADLVPLKTPPFYAVRVHPCAVMTTGGIKADVQARVLRFGGAGDKGPVSEPIPGLYAAGQAVEWAVTGGWTFGSAFTIGRIAGQNAAAEKPWV